MKLIRAIGDVELMNYREGPLRSPTRLKITKEITFKNRKTVLLNRKNRILQKMCSKTITSVNRKMPKTRKD